MREREREREKERERERERELPIHELVTAIFSFQNTIPSSATSGVSIKLIDKLVKESKTKAIQVFFIETAESKSISDQQLHKKIL